MAATFRDPEGMYYMSRQLSYLGADGHAMEMLRRAVDQGFFCYPVLVRDSWLDGLRGKPEFSKVLHKARELHLDAFRAFQSGGGDALLGVRPEERIEPSAPGADIAWVDNLDSGTSATICNRGRKAPKKNRWNYMKRLVSRVGLEPTTR